MCLAIPGKVLKIEGNKITVEYPHLTQAALNSGLDLKIGDYVMIQMGIIVKKVTADEAEISINAWKQN